MKKSLWVIPAILLAFSSAGAKTVDRILAQVGDDIITLSELNREMAPYLQDLQSKYTGEELDQEVKKTEKQVLDGIVQEKLLYQKAMELGFSADIEKDVSAAIQGIIKANPQLKDTEGLEAELEKSGQTLKELRDYYKRKIIVEGLIDYFVRSRITLLAPEVEKYYKDHLSEFSSPEEVTLSEIAIAVKGNEKDAENRANDIYNRLQQGESFPNLASQYSSGVTAGKGGSIGSYLLSTLNADTVKAISSLKEGEVSKPQKEKDNYMIYRLDARKASVVKPLEEVKNTIKDRLFNQKYYPELDRYVSGIKEDAYIQYFSEIK